MGVAEKSYDFGSVFFQNAILPPIGPPLAGSGRYSGVRKLLYFFLRIAVLFLCENCPEGVLNFYMPGNFRTRVHFEKRDMAVESNMPCLVLKSLDGHETGRQATDLDENFGTPYSF